ncbi:MAG: M3 family metallopeptidase [Burkholderiales bacterium]|nr:M3 family metallopeptidase [Burkholderiales bacterium]
MTEANENPLLDFSGLPRFADIRPAHVAPAIARLLAEAREAVRAAEAAPPTWDAFVAPLEDANERLARAWGCVAHLHAVMDSPAMREAYNANLPKVTQYWTGLGQNERLFANWRALRASPEFARFPAARRRVVENALRDYRLAGAELAPEAKRRFAQIQEELAALAARFAENLLDATNAFALYVEEEARLAGIPEDVREAAREAARKEGRAGWKFTLHMPSYLPVLQHAEDRALRYEMYRASATRASEFGPAERDNTPLIARILQLRREAARLLGYANYAEVSLVPKMAKTPAQVIAFLRDLARRARPFAEREAEELRAFARAELGLADLQAWDVAFAAEKLRERRYAFSEQDVKQYFPEPKVLEGLFRVAEAVFGIRIRPAQAPVWHEDVRFYEIRDRAGALVGQFYTDLYARETKRGGAWMDEAIARRRRRDGAIQTPVAYLACNFARPVGAKPALLSHEDVLTLFHEFGHCLHHLLTRVEELGVSGLAGVEWDAVELPSQFMENFGWEWEVLREMSAHVETGEPLPRALFDRMRAAKNFQAGLAMLRQVEYALFDMRVHAEYAPEADPDGTGVQRLLDEVRREVAVLVPPPWNRFQTSFSHVFAGGYAAGYYSYKWAEVLSSDAFGVFEERGALDAEAGARFRDEILAVGGSRPAAESFRAFRGRDPDIEALFRRSGMIAA